MEDYASQITCPVFITSAQNEEKEWKRIYNKIKTKKTFFIPQTKGTHGSKALWEMNEDSQEYWQAVESFLQKFKK